MTNTQRPMITKSPAIMTVQKRGVNGNRYISVSYMLPSGSKVRTTYTPDGGNFNARAHHDAALALARSEDMHISNRVLMVTTTTGIIGVNRHNNQHLVEEG